MIPSRMELLDLLKRSEGKMLGFKRDLSSPDGELKTIVTFAITADGTLLIGMEDRGRNVRGEADPQDEEQRLANLIIDRISPRFVPEIEILPWRQTHVLALQVHPSPSRPHHLIREGPAAGVDVPVGSTNRPADAELVEELRRFSRAEGFDEQPLPGLSSEAISFEVVRTVPGPPLARPGDPAARGRPPGNDGADRGRHDPLRP